MLWDEWQAVLAKEFRVGPGEPVFLYVDDDVVADLGGSHGAEDLGTAVRSALGAYYVYQPIRRRAARSWDPDGQSPPPTLPLLALTVLAASRMERGAGMSANAYYKRLWDAVNVEPGSVQSEQMRNQFGEVAGLWVQLHEWLGAAGRQYGVSTVRLADPRLTRIGYPLSQALLRKTDRNVLTRLWAVLGREVISEISDQELVDHLQRWMRTDRGLSHQFVDTVAQLTDQTRPAFAEAVYQAAQRWDGVVRSRSGRLMHDAVLAVQPTVSGRWNAVWIIDTPGQATTVALKADDLVDRPVVFAAEGEEWTGINDGVAVLRWDSLQGCWVAADRMLPEVAYALVWHRRVESAVRAFVSKSLGAGSLKPRQVTHDGAFFIEDVRFGSDAAITASLKGSGLIGIRLAGSRSPRLAIADGLKVTNPLHNAIFIQGGEPDLAIPAGPEPFLAVSLDGSASTNFTRGVLVPLRGIANAIPCGPHVLQSDEGTLHFETISPGSTVVGPGPRQSVGAAGKISETMATVDHDPFGMSLVMAKRRRDDTWLVGPSARIRRINEPSAPQCWNTLLSDQADPLHFLIRRKSAEGWLIQRKGEVYFVDEISAVPAEVPACSR